MSIRFYKCHVHPSACIECLNCFFFLKKIQKNKGQWISSAEEEPKPTFLVCIDLTLKMYKFVRTAVFFRKYSWEILHKMFISPLKHIQKIRWVNFKNIKKIIWCLNCFFFWLWKYAKKSRWVNSKCRRKNFKNIIGCLNCFFFLTLKNMPKNQGEWILSAEGRAQTNFFSLYLPDFENVQNLMTNKHLLFLTLKYWVSELLLFLT